MLLNCATIALVLAAMFVILAGTIAIITLGEHRRKVEWIAATCLVLLLLLILSATVVDLMSNHASAAHLWVSFAWLVLAALLVIGLLQMRRRSRQSELLEDARRESQASFSSFLHNFHGIAFRTTLDFVPMFFLGAVQDITGYQPDDFMEGRPRWDEIIHPDDLRRIVDENNPKLRSEPGIEIQHEYRIRHKNGTMRWVREAIANIHDEQGRIVCLQGAIYDITAHKQTEQALQFTQFAVDKAGIGILWHGPDERIIYANEAMCSMLEYSCDEVVRLTVRDINPELRNKPADELWRPFKAAQHFQTEGSLQTKSGRLVPVEIVINWVAHMGGEYCCAFVRDITERHESVARLSHEHALFNALMETIPDYIYFKDCEGRFFRINRAMCKLLGVDDPARILGKTDFDFFSAEHSRKSLKDEQTVIRSGHPIVNKEECETGPAGHVTWMSTTTMPLRDEHGATIGVFVFARDITGQKRTTEQLVQAQKMDAIGQLAGGIAHDFNNLLTGIMGYADLLTHSVKPGSPEHEAAQTIEKAAERASELTTQLLGFARQNVFHGEVVDIHQVVAEVIKLVGRTFDKNISIVQRFHPERATLMGDPGQLQQVILNLAVNARDAMAKGGELTFETALVSLDDRFSFMNGGVTPGEYVKVSVTDTGCGIPPEIRARIFEPFFTTKESGKGTGMGLALVYSIVKNHKGFIQVYSEVGRGTTFKVYLPYTKTHEDVEAPVPVTAPVHGHGRILVVDDEELVRVLTTNMLKSLGYDVLAVSGGQEAIAVYTKEHMTIGMAIIDLAMPDMSGQEVFRALRAIDPTLKAVLSTGYGMNSKAKEAMDEGMQGFIQKPYRMDDLATAVANTLKK